MCFFQRKKREQKQTTKNFVQLHNHPSPLVEKVFLFGFQMMADLMFRKNEYDSATFHFQQLLERKPGIVSDTSPLYSPVPSLL